MKDITVAGHQPNFFPWFGYFEKMLLADVFVFSDDVQYTKQNYVNRVPYPLGKDRIDHYLTLSVEKGNDQRIADKRYQKDARVLEKLLKTVRINLGGLPYFRDIEEILRAFEDAFWRLETVADLNIATILDVAGRFGIGTRTLRGSELGLDQWHANERLLKRQELLQSRIYLSGAGASEYTDESSFRERGLRLDVISYTLGPELFGENLKYSVLYGIGTIGTRRIAEAVPVYKRASRA